MDDKNWTWDDYEFLYRNYNIIPVKEIAAKLERSVSSVNAHAEKLGLIPIPVFPKKDINIAQTYGAQLGTALVFMLPEYSTAKMEELLQCINGTQQ